MGVDPIPKSRKPRTVVAFEDSFSLKKGNLKKTWTNPLNANYSATYPPLVPVREYQDSARLLGESCWQELEEQIARKSRNSRRMSSGEMGAEGMVRNLPNCSPTYNQMQTLKECLCCRIYSARPTESIMYIPFQVNIFQRSILLIVQYKYLKSCSEDLIVKNPTKIWFSAQDPAVLLLILNIVGFFISARQKSASWKWFVPQLYQHRRGILDVPALKYFYMIHRGGRLALHSTNLLHLTLQSLIGSPSILPALISSIGCGNLAYRNSKSTFLRNQDDSATKLTELAVAMGSLLFITDQWSRTKELSGGERPSSSFLLGFHRPNLITGLSGWQAPD